MAFSPIALTIPNYRDFKNYWIKAYVPSTTTPKVMASDKTGSPTVAKFELNTEGFPKTSGGALITPYIDGLYDLWLFPTEAEADANDTSNALRIAINVSSDSVVNDTIDRLNPDTLAIWQADAFAKAEDVIDLKERTPGNGGGLTGDVITGTGTADGFGVVAHGTLSLSLVVRTDDGFHGDQFGMEFNDTTDDTLALRAVMAAALPTKATAILRVGTTLITDSVSFPEGSKIKGQKPTQYNDGFGVDPLNTRINFQPTTAKSLFVVDGIDHTGFRLHLAASGMFIKGNGSAISAFDLNGSIYGAFSDLSITEFDEPINCDATINNKFDNIYMEGRTACVAYEGNLETTDVWTHCTFFNSPVGNLFRGASIGVRFVNCLYEQLNDGAIIAKECQSIMYDTCYSEDVVVDNAPSGAMFKVGLTGSTVAIDNQLIISGGKYSGRNAGVQGSFISADDTNGIVVTGLSMSRFVTGIKTTVNTRDDSIIISGIASKSVTTQIDDLSKIVGLYPHSSIGDAGAESRVRSPVILTQELRQADSYLGLKVGAGGDKVSMFGALPVLQPSSTGETSGFTAGGGVTMTSASTFSGGLGSTAYRVSDIVKALKQIGIIAL